MGKHQITLNKLHVLSQIGDKWLIINGIIGQLRIIQGIKQCVWSPMVFYHRTPVLEIYIQQSMGKEVGYPRYKMECPPKNK